MNNINKEYNINDIVYLMYENSIIKAIITAKIEVYRENLNIESVLDLNEIQNHPSNILNFISRTKEILYNVAMLPKNKDDIDMSFIKGVFVANDFYTNIPDLVSDLIEKCK